MSTKKYKGTPLQMLLALRSILENAISMADLIKTVRPKWDQAFLESQLEVVNNALRTHYGVTFSMSLTDRTEIISRVAGSARTILQQIKVQIDLDFRKDYGKHAELSSTLGLNKVKDLSCTTDNCVLVVLQCFSSGITAELKNDLTNAGMNPKLIDDAVSLAGECGSLNVEIDRFDRTPSGLTYEQSRQMEEIYQAVDDITTIISVLLPDVAEVESLSYEKALLAIGYVEPPKREYTPSTHRRKRRRY